jgi:hypothetical protein
MSRFCLDCQAELKGRADKKFCDDQCRNNYNNKLKSEDGESVRKINQILNKNRKILKEFADGDKLIKTDLLVKKGFDFDYHTHYHLSNSGMVYICCYDNCYLIDANEDVVFLQQNPRL